MRSVVIVGNVVVALYLSAMGLAQMLGRDTGSNVLPAVLVAVVVILRALTERQQPAR